MCVGRGGGWKMRCGAVRSGGRGEVARSVRRGGTEGPRSSSLTLVSVPSGSSRLSCVRAFAECFSVVRFIACPQVVSFEGDRSISFCSCVCDVDPPSCPSLPILTAGVPAAPAPRPSSPPLQAGETPLHKAAFNGHLESVRLLLDSGAEKEVMDKWCVGREGAVCGKCLAVQCVVEGAWRGPVASA